MTIPTCLICDEDFWEKTDKKLRETKNSELILVPKLDIPTEMIGDPLGELIGIKLVDFVTNKKTKKPAIKKENLLDYEF